MLLGTPTLETELTSHLFVRMIGVEKWSADLGQTHFPPLVSTVLSVPSPSCVLRIVAKINFANLY